MTAPRFSRWLLAAVATVGCAPKPATEAPTAQPVPAAAPPPVDNPMVQPPAPAVLDVASLRFVAVFNGEFPTFTAKVGQPTLVMDVLVPEGEEPYYEIAERIADDGETIVLAPPLAEVFELPEVSEVWLFGPEGPCQAEVGEPYATGYIEGFLALELGYRLEPCADRIAPIAHVGPNPPQLRWVPAERELLGEIEQWKSWKHELRPILDEWGWTTWPKGEAEPHIYARVVRAGSALELGYAQHWPGPTCEDEDEAVHVSLGLYGEGKFRELPPVDEHYASERLVGALVDDAGVSLVIAEQQFQMFAWTARNPDAWAVFATGSYHDEDVAEDGWSVLEHYCGP